LRRGSFSLILGAVGFCDAVRSAGDVAVSSGLLPGAPPAFDFTTRGASSAAFGFTRRASSVAFSAARRAGRDLESPLAGLGGLRQRGKVRGEIWMWGVPGAILSIPMLAITKIICDGVKPLNAIGHFLEGDDE
jgi:hypothetical protein